MQSVSAALAAAIEAPERHPVVSLKVDWDRDGMQIGKPNILSEAQIQTVIEKFRTYGQQPEPAPGCC